MVSRSDKLRLLRSGIQRLPALLSHLFDSAASVFSLFPLACGSHLGSSLLTCPYYPPYYLCTTGLPDHKIEWRPNTSQFAAKFDDTFLKSF